MLTAVLLVLAQCDQVPPAPKIPLPTEFQCPGGATAEARGGGVECLTRDGKLTGDTFSIDGRTGLMVHPLGLTVAWVDGAVSWFHQRPTGHRVAYETGKVARVEHFVGGELTCARFFEQGRLVRRFDAGKWSWLDKQGRAIEPKVPLDRAEIASVMREHQPEVQLCYEARLHEVQKAGDGREPEKLDFRGTVALTVDIENGEAKSVKVSEDTLHDPPVSDCVTQRVQTWRFRPASEAVEVTFPFVFKERR